ncbi:hypothetical protein AAFC00_004629 [Neodothiora populina]|uniref:Uncharacterized protein n=1 Tax=Neodothiora populina TaxID=2781224 RepID=A0ABR3P2V2_9PEZI
MEWSKKQYNSQYDKWVPWAEDMYLYYFSKDNKASYATKGELNKTKITGNEQVDNLQDGVNNLVGGQVGQGGLLQPVGDAASKEGVNRAERGGKDDKGTFGGPAASYTDSAVGGASAGAGKVAEGAKGAGGYLGGLWGGGKK